MNFKKLYKNYIRNKIMVQYFGATITIQQFDHIFSFTLQGAAPIEVSHGHGSNGGARHA